MARLSQGQPKEEWGQASASCTAQFAAARLSPQWSGIIARGQRGGSAGFRAVRSQPVACRGAAEVEDLEVTYCPDDHEGFGKLG